MSAGPRTHGVLYQPGDETLKARSIVQLCQWLAPLGGLSQLLNVLVSTFERLREDYVVS